MMVAAILISFGLLIVIGIPIGFCLGLIPLVSTMFFMRFSPKVIPHEMFSSLDTFPLMAIPLFILAGNLMNTARITHQLIRLSNSLVGWIRGGLAQVNIVVSMLFAGLNGSAVADAVSVGSVLIPVMKDEGYDADFAAGGYSQLVDDRSDHTSQCWHGYIWFHPRGFHRSPFRSRDHPRFNDRTCADDRCVRHQCPEKISGSLRKVPSSRISQAASTLHTASHVAGDYHRRDHFWCFHGY